MKLGAITTLLIVAVASPAVASTLYSVTAVGPAGSDAYGINNLGNVVGSTPNGSATDPFLWTPGGGLQDLGTLGGNSVARAINDNNQIVGQSDATAFRWTSGSGIVQLDAAASDARAINSSNVVIGFQGSGLRRDDGTVDGRQRDAGGVFRSKQQRGLRHQRRRRHRGSIQLRHRGLLFQTEAPQRFLGQFLPDAINNSDLIVGSESGIATVAGLTNPGSPNYTTIGTLNPTDTSSEAFAINELNQAVGVSTGTGAFLWDSTNGIQNLSQMLAPGSSGWTILSGNGINNNGQIVGLGQFDGQQYAVLLTPDPRALDAGAVGHRGDGGRDGRSP